MYVCVTIPVSVLPDPSCSGMDGFFNSLAVAFLTGRSHRRGNRSKKNVAKQGPTIGFYSDLVRGKTNSDVRPLRDARCTKD